MGVKISGSCPGKLTMRMQHTPSGKIIDTDPPVDNGGEGKSFSPTDLLATAYGSCLMTIAALQAKKDGVDLADMTIDIEKHMSADIPRRVAALDVHLKFPTHLSKDQRSRYFAAGVKCPVALSLSPEIKIRVSFT